jgi:hypothetical protein
VEQAPQQQARGNSYVKLRVDRLTDRDTDPVLVDRIPITLFFPSTALSLVRIMRDHP